MLLNLAAILSGPAVLVSVDLQKKYALNSMVPKPPSVEFFLFISEKTQYYFLHKVYITGSLVAFHHEVKVGKITKWRLNPLKASWGFRGMTVPGFRLLIPEMFSNTFRKEQTRSMIALVTMRLSKCKG